MELNEVNAMDKNEVLTDPKKLVRLELENQGFDIDKMKM